MIHRLLPFLSALKPTRLGVLFAVLVGLGVGFWQWGRPPRPRVVLETPAGSFYTIFAPGYFSPNGRLLLTVHNTKPHVLNRTYFAVWDIQTGQKKFDFEESRHLEDAVFSPDGRTLACVFDKQIAPQDRLVSEIRVWDLSSGRELPSIEADSPCSNLLFFSEQGRLLALHPHFGPWDVANKKMVKNLLLKGEKIIGRGENTILVRTPRDTIKVWNVGTQSLVSESVDFLNLWKENGIGPRGNANNRDLFWDRFFLIAHLEPLNQVFIFDLVTGNKKQVWNDQLKIAPDGQTIAYSTMNLEQPSWWNRLIERVGSPKDPSDIHYVILKTVVSGEEVVALNRCTSPMFSPDGKTLAVFDPQYNFLQLWDLPIHKPIGKILGLAALAAVATLLAFNAFGWLRRNRMRRKANVVPTATAEAG
jgi:WD40 repeat protein